jgi:hypothetical protein
MYPGSNQSAKKNGREGPGGLSEGTAEKTRTLLKPLDQ